MSVHVSDRIREGRHTLRDLSDELGTAVGVGVVIVETDCSVVADILVVFGGAVDYESNLRPRKRGRETGMQSRGRGWWWRRAESGGGGLNAQTPLSARAPSRWRSTARAGTTLLETASSCQSSESAVHLPSLHVDPYSTSPSPDNMSLPPQLLHTLEGIKYQVKDAFWALSSCICQQSAKVKINGRTCARVLWLDAFRVSPLLVVKIIRVLGEGGFSFVYLAQDEHSGVRHCCSVAVP